MRHISAFEVTLFKPKEGGMAKTKSLESLDYAEENMATKTMRGRLTDYTGSVDV